MIREHKFLEDALQGLAFWIGYRKSLFFDYPISESALVAEACSLIQSRLSPEFVLSPERMYKDLVPRNQAHKQIEFERTRADLVICCKSANSNGRKNNIYEHAKYVIEVKRACAPKKDIEKDLERLAGFLNASGYNSRAFLFLISQGRQGEFKKLSPRFINKNGKSVRQGSIKNSDTPVCYRVRRVLKAATSFNGKSSANYACLIEVLRRKGKTE